MNQLIMGMIALGALLGGVDYLLGNRFGLGQAFEKAFHLWGATALSMVGILCLVPLISLGLEYTLVPLWQQIGLDPGMLGGVIAIDMGGYQLANALSANESVVAYAGLMISATLGVTITFTIPMGMGMMREEDKPLFARGLMLGTSALPFILTLGGLLCGLTLKVCLLQNIPVYLLTFCLWLGLQYYPKQMVLIFSFFAKGIRFLGIVGLLLGVLGYLTGVSIPLIGSITEATATVSAIVLVMSGSLPLAQLLQKILLHPLEKLAKRLKVNVPSLIGLLIGAISVTPALVMFSQMDKRGKIINAAAMVCSASALAAHLGFTYAVDSAMVGPLMCVKLIGGFVGACVGYFVTKS